MSELSFINRRTFVGGAAALGASACLLGTNPLQAFAEPTAADKQAEAEAALNKLNAMQQQLDMASNDYYAAQQAQEEAQAKMDECQGRIDEANEQITALQGQLSERARSMYRSGSTTFVDLLLGATSFQAFTTSWDLLNDMNENDAEMVQQTKDLKAQVEAEQAEYAEQERIAAEQAEQARQVKEEAEQLVAETQAIYDNLSAEAAELLEQEQAAREAAAAAAAQAAIEEEQRQQQQQQNNGGGGGGSTSGDSKPQTVTGNVVVDRAYSKLGCPYVWGATGPNTFDCSGLVGYCLTGSTSRLGTTYTFMRWPRVSNPQPGDICTSSTHCGIYIGGGQMIHAPHTGDVVKIGGVQSNMIYVRY